MYDAVRLTAQTLFYVYPEQGSQFSHGVHRLLHAKHMDSSFTMSSTDKAVETAQAAIRQGDYRRAEAILEKINAAPATQSLQGLLLYSHALEAQHKIMPAVAALEIAESRTSAPEDKARILNKAADLLCAAREVPQADIERAIGFLERSVALGSHPATVISRRNLCALYFRLKNHQAVARHAKSLLKVPALRTKALLWLAGSCFHFNQEQQGAHYLEEAFAGYRNMDEADARWLLEILINYSRYEQAQALMDDIFSGHRPDPVLRKIQAQIFYGAGKYERVLAILAGEVTVSQQPDALLNQSVFYLRGRSLDALGRYAEAHECFVAMNETARQSWSAPLTPGMTAAYTGTDLANLPKYDVPESSPYVPTFMVGFPRSGTTLLDTILDTQKRIATLSEVAGMMAAKGAMTAAGRKYPEDLPLLTKSEADRLREVYFSHNAQYLEPGSTFGLLIDKLPLNILHIPFIRVLFPDARFILSLRHPLDVCLSCFQQGFQLNDEMIHFTNLETTFRRYRDVMNTFEHFQNTCELNLLTVRYEDLVENFDATANRVFTFLDIVPDENYRRFHELNKKKLLATPSRNQITRPIYRSSRFRWKNYATFLEPHIEIVQPFIDKFGYSTA